MLLWDSVIRILVIWHVDVWFLPIIKEFPTVLDHISHAIKVILKIQICFSKSIGFFKIMLQPNLPFSIKKVHHIYDVWNYWNIKKIQTYVFHFLGFRDNISPLHTRVCAAVSAHCREWRNHRHHERGWGQWPCLWVHRYALLSNCTLILSVHQRKGSCTRGDLKNSQTRACDGQNICNPHSSVKCV